ncbi:hypothetical protein FJMB80055_32540 [Enterobacter hormaechei]|nr:hypothetical protein OIPHN069_08640 [Enterobacter hormaechei subsp. hoffmannii]BDI91656.1 hypothetical protein FJMB80004_08680 [Enterobacter hormaechei]BDJ11318.1 hypothetical protein FJMB80011_08920 [Enterobacter hormaechei]BDJ16155.1 hypothetical protein FJMB80012_08560 [Enterobacter hormaechei]BDJ30878.1 hypothetical protein FJMB80017_08700 [Enterobacter hormaechei]
MAVFMLFDMFSYVTTLMSFIPGKWNPFCTENPYLISFDIKIDTTALNASVKYFFSLCLANITVDAKIIGII